MILRIVRAQWLLVRNVSAGLFGIVVTVGFWTLLFAIGVRCWSLSGWDQPSLRSFDPMQRAAAAESAARKYGGKP